jgi:hypothetical protein
VSQKGEAGFSHPFPCRGALFDNSLVEIVSALIGQTHGPKEVVGWEKYEPTPDWYAVAEAAAPEPNMMSR